MAEYSSTGYLPIQGYAATSPVAGTPAYLSIYLRRQMIDAGLDPEVVSLTAFQKPDDTEHYYAIKCQKCKQYAEQIVCAWSTGFGLDELVKFILEFSKVHQHEPFTLQPEVLLYRLAPGRKFRD